MLHSYWSQPSDGQIQESPEADHAEAAAFSTLKLNDWFSSYGKRWHHHLIGTNYRR